MPYEVRAKAGESASRAIRPAMVTIGLQCWQYIMLAIHDDPVERLRRRMQE
jgi:hypothetical protein